MTLAGRYQVHGVRKMSGDPVAVLGRCDRVELTGQQKHRHVDRLEVLPEDRVQIDAGVFLELDRAKMPNYKHLDKNILKPTLLSQMA